MPGSFERSIIFGPLNLLSDINLYREPHLVADAEVVSVGLGLSFVRGNCDANRYIVDYYADQLAQFLLRRSHTRSSLAALYCKFYLCMMSDKWTRKSVRLIRRQRAFVPTS